MSELHRALAEIKHIRCQVARDTQFRGYGPASVAASGVLALLVAARPVPLDEKRDRLPRLRGGVDRDRIPIPDDGDHPDDVSRPSRARRARDRDGPGRRRAVPAGPRDRNAADCCRSRAPRRKRHGCSRDCGNCSSASGVFASCRFLPRLTFAVGVWYLIAGLTTLIVQGRISGAAALDHGHSVRNRTITGRRRLPIRL